MKLITTVATAAALLAASLIPSAAVAEPSRTSMIYHVIDITPTEFGFMSDSVQKVGDKRLNWMMLSLPVKNGIVSMLNEYDCAGNTVRQVRARVEQIEGGQAVEKPINKIRTIPVGSRQADVRDVVCGRKKPQEAGLVSVDVTMLAAALAGHVEKAREATI